MIDLSAVYQLRDDARYRKVAGEGVVLQQTAAEVVMLNGTGADVLELIDGERRVSDIVDALAGDYDIEKETLTADVSAYVQELVGAGVISELSPEAAD